MFRPRKHDSRGLPGVKYQARVINLGKPRLVLVPRAVAPSVHSMEHTELKLSTNQAWHSVSIVSLSPFFSPVDLIQAVLILACCIGPLGIKEGARPV